MCRDLGALERFIALAPTSTNSCAIWDQISKLVTFQVQTECDKKERDNDKRMLELQQEYRFDIILNKNKKKIKRY